MSDGKCLIWGTDATRLELARDGLVNSPRAGGCYVYPRDLSLLRSSIFSLLQKLDDRAKASLTTLLVDQRRLLGHECPITKLLDLHPLCLLNQECPNLTAEMIKSAKGKPGLSNAERADRLLQYFEQQVFHMGQIEGTNIDEGGYAWSESVNESEYSSLCVFLKERKWLKYVGGIDDLSQVPKSITEQGDTHLKQLKKN